MKRYSLILFCLLLLAGTLLAQRSKSPSAEDKIKSYVTDKTGTLTTAQLQLLESKLSGFDKETSTQVVVWMVPSLEGESLEEKSYEIAEQNGIGQKGKNNGALLFIAKNDKKLRIEVGYGLEGALTDALCSQIIRKEITPYFKQGKFYEGINAGVDAILKATKGEYTQDKKTSKDNESGTICCGIPIMFLVIAFFIFIFVVMPILSRIFRWGRGGRSNNWWWTGGSGWSSGSSGSSWSGGGFSGGGGSFGGGGASGSW